MATTARLLDGSTLAGIIEDYKSLEWTRPFLTPGPFRLELRQSVASALNIQIGMLLEPPDEPGLVYLIEQIERDRGDTDTLIVSGRDLGGYLLERDCVPPAGQMHDVQTNVSAEAAMKHYVDVNAGPSAPIARQIPGLVLAIDQGRPANSPGTYRARYQYVSEILNEIGVAASLGWEVRLNYATGQYVFEVLPGVNRATSVGGDRVYFDPEFGTARTQQWVTGNLGQKTIARVLGQGEGAARTVIVTWLGQAAGAPEPTGMGRRELVIDARDLVTTDGLVQRGQAKLAETLATNSFAIEVNQYGQFRYQRDWNLGDLVVVRNRDWGIQQTGQIVSVKARLESKAGTTPAITIEIGRPAPTLRDVLLGGTLGSGSARN